jgi:hypothetical protein
MRFELAIIHIVAAPKAARRRGLEAVKQEKEGKAKICVRENGSAKAWLATIVAVACSSSRKNRSYRNLSKALLLSSDGI